MNTWPFLTARWSNLSLFTFAVAQERLAPRLPAGIELDTRDGRAFVSVVGLDFQDTRILGMGWPGFRAFPDINFRFYARRGDQRGVVFIREIVPHRFVAWMARTCYGEPFVSAPLTSKVIEESGTVSVERRFDLGGRIHRLRMTGSKPALSPPASSDEHFFTERGWGWSRNRRGETESFRVEHPVWNCYPVVAFEFDFDWGLVYGEEWAFLTGAKPLATALAVGSEIKVFPRGMSSRGFSISPLIAR